ncbi:putative nepenthesin [Rosa chinensis]|uniref:Putative nepenthesin n=3 Tax=Rosa chinensis TaxID=74649 RepID=A0A2P6R5S8_ROSCH|nr:aspartic proteinase CDR1 [Rosa chinensis]PRQ41786.1 putative nepenthesin [Rosa chinensis]
MAMLCRLQKNNYIIAIINLFFFHLMYCSVLATTNINNNNGGFSAHLIRKNSPNSPLYKHKNNKVHRRLMGPNTPGSRMKIDPGSGEHIMKFSMGTPPFDIYAIADTGSDLLWTQCQPCKACYKTNFGVFDPRKSSTYRNITCRASDCRLVALSRPLDYQPNFCRENPKGPCLYRYAYMDTSSSTGALAKETVTLTSTTGKVVTLKDIIFGCGNENNSTITGTEMGVIGLGRGPLSFVSQIAPYVGGKRFSHCLVPDPNIESKIYFGNGSEVLGEGVLTVPLFDEQPGGSNYYVTVPGITIGNDFVPFNSTGTLLTKGNMLVDSGTPMTYLPQEFFDRVVAQLKKTVELESFISPEDSTLCFNSTTVPKFPTVALHFEGGGELPLNETQLFQRNEETKAFCFMMVNTTTEDYGTFGGSLQIDFLIGFDLDTKVVSFKPTNCANFNKS